MMQGAKRRALAALATALAAVALALAVGGRGCGDRDDGPSSVVRDFVDKAHDGDKSGLYSLLGPRTRAWLDRESQRASQMIGGSHRYGALDLLVTMRSAPPARLALRERDGDRAVVELVDQEGKSSTVELVRHGGRWRIELIGAEDER